MRPELRSRVEEYGAVHRNPVNRALHLLGIPLLGVGSLGLLSRLAVPVGAGAAALEPNVAWPAVLAALVWYAAVGRWSGLPAFAVVVACYAAGTLIPIGVLVALWFVGAAAHTVGHYGFEGKPPAVLSDPRSVLEAPAWLLALVGGTLPR